MFEYENDFLVVDEMIIDPSLPNAIVVRINDSYFMINHANANKPIAKEALRPYKKNVYKDWHRATYDNEFWVFGIMPRGGFKVPLGRPITAEEFKELRDKYGLTAEDITNEFDDKIGSIYGKYAKDIKSVQIKVLPEKAIPLESELRDRGIESGNTASGRVNIRTDWGGYREGAGRKPTGRRIARIYVTEEEEKKLREYLDKLRNE